MAKQTNMNRDLSANGFIGSLPKSIWKLPALTHVVKKNKQTNMNQKIKQT